MASLMEIEAVTVVKDVPIITGAYELCDRLLIAASAIKHNGMSSGRIPSNACHDL